MNRSQKSGNSRTSTETIDPQPLRCYDSRYKLIHEVPCISSGIWPERFYQLPEIACLQGRVNVDSFFLWMSTGAGTGAFFVAL